MNKETVVSLNKENSNDKNKDTVMSVKCIYFSINFSSVSCYTYIFLLTVK